MAKGLCRCHCDIEVSWILDHLGGPTVIARILMKTEAGESDKKRWCENGSRERVEDAKLLALKTKRPWMQRLREVGKGQGTVSRMSSWISDLVTLWLLAQGEPSWIPDLQDCEMIVWAVSSHQVMVICCSRTGNWDAALEKGKGTCGRAARETGNPDPGAAAFGKNATQNLEGHFTPWKCI